MKFLALFLTGLMFLLPFAGSGNAASVSAEKTCCHKMDSHACNKSKGTEKDNCGSGTCNMLMGCSQCGFLAADRPIIAPLHFSYLSKPVTPYKIGDLSDFHSPGWQPPEV